MYRTAIYVCVEHYAPMVARLFAAPGSRGRTVYKRASSFTVKLNKTYHTCIGLIGVDSKNKCQYGGCRTTITITITITTLSLYRATFMTDIFSCALHGHSIILHKSQSKKVCFQIRLKTFWVIALSKIVWQIIPYCCCLSGKGTVSQCFVFHPWYNQGTYWNSLQGLSALYTSRYLYHRQN